MNESIADIIAQIPEWADDQDLTIKPLGGLTNWNYQVTVNGENFVLRVSGKNSEYLGIKRESELEILTAMSSAGIGPEVMRFILPAGHLITRLIKGRQLTLTEFRTPQNLNRMVAVVKQIHSLSVVKGRFSPFRRVEAYAKKARNFNVSLPDDFDDFVTEMRAIEEVQRQDSSHWLGLCHNDLYSENFLDDGEIRIIDWEFAGMGDIYFDLAALVYAYESDAPLSLELERYLLKCYFGETDSTHQTRLDGMKFMLHFFAAMWGLLQYGLQSNGIVSAIDDFDCFAYAQDKFVELRQWLN